MHYILQSIHHYPRIEFFLKTSHKDLAIECLYSKAKILCDNGGEDKEEEKDRLKKTIIYCDRIIEIESSHEDAYNLKGVAYAKKKEFEEAIKCFEKALEINPNFIKFDDKEDKNFYDLNNRIEALKYIEETLEKYFKAANIILSSLSDIGELFSPLKYAKEAKEFLELLIIHKGKELEKSNSKNDVKE